MMEKKPEMEEKPQDETAIAREAAEKLLSEKIVKFKKIGDGWCNFAFSTRTESGKKLLVKVYNPSPKAIEKNDLLVEAKIIQTIKAKKPELKLPDIVFVSENPKMYCYRYVEGDIMREMWNGLSEKKRTRLFETMGKLHADMGTVIPKTEAQNMGLEINFSPQLSKHTLDWKAKVIADTKLPKRFAELANEAFRVFSNTPLESLFAFTHCDSHHANILLDEKGNLASLIDFGDSRYGNVYVDLTRYFQDYPDYHEIVLKSYEEHSGNTLSRAQYISHSILLALPYTMWLWYEGRKKKTRRLMKSYKKALAPYL